MAWKQDIVDWVQTHTGIATGAAFTALATFVIKLRGSKRIDYQFLLQRLDSEVKNLRDEVNQLRNTIEDRDRQLAILRAGRFELPVAVWLKDKTGRYLDFNRAFITGLLIPNGIDPDTVIGKTDADLWPQFAEEYRANDLVAMRTRSNQEQIEVLEVGGQILRFKSIKYPFFIQHRVVGVGGIAFQIEDQ